MVRFKDDAPERRVKVSKKMDESETAPASGSRLVRSRKRAGAKRGVIAVVVVAVFLAVGWFAARMVIAGMDGSGGSWWEKLLGRSTVQLAGEDDGRVNFLMLGIPGTDGGHDGPYLTDTIMIASYAPESGALHLFSVPRDFYASVTGYGMTKINAVWEIGENRFGDAPGTTLKTIEDLTGLTIP